MLDMMNIEVENTVNERIRKMLQRGKEKAAKYILLIMAGISILAVILICYFLFRNGIPAIMEIGIGNFLGGLKWKPTNNIYGIFPMILGSICVTGCAVILGVPLGILAAVFMSRFCQKWLYRILTPGVQLLAGIPSVVYGFFGLMVIVPAIRSVFGGAGTSNLADNAIRYNKEDGNVWITVARENGMTTLTVADDGIGIPPEDRSRVFERFYRVDKSHSSKTGGTGLGLSIVKHAVQYHDASIELKSEVGKGTVFCIRFSK